MLDQTKINCSDIKIDEIKDEPKFETFGLKSG
jgi:hypothetical protein